MSRAALDAYYTPDAVALRCVRWLSLRIPTPRRIVEPSVGGGSWVRAVRQVWPAALVDAYDVNPAAPGLALADRAEVADWLTVRPQGWDLVLGNPPYDLADRHITHSVRAGSGVALLLRETITGGVARWRDLWSRCPPAWIGKLPERVTWEGASSHDSPDTVGHVLMVWGSGGGTRWDWIAERSSEINMFGGG